ncbi:MAG: peptide chain release factor N(5)-glutamine methyltransferase [Alphaproteobacteria bacterium]|nr:peptide chain release factor N(5)-glutamine methyltransferase [Alphaproteobacteria bacterium]
MPDDKSTAPKRRQIPLTGELTRAQAILLASKALADAGINGASRDARALVAAAVRCSSLALITEPETLLGAEASIRLAKMVQRRTAHEPVSRIIGEREFYGRTFEITPATLDPRPDSETIVDAALELMANRDPATGGLKILDIGTGTGCLAITLIAELPGATALAVDICPEALEVARRNAARTGVENRISFQQTDLLENIAGKYNLVVSNPPYIPTGDIARLDPDVRSYDPECALDGGSDGLCIYRRLAPALAADNSPIDQESWIIFECGAGQAQSVTAIFRDAGFSQSRLYKDLSGHSRCVAVRSRR